MMRINVEGTRAAMKRRSPLGVERVVHTMHLGPRSG